MEKLKIIGHRGARGLAPENTIASFKAALDAGVDMIEFDVRVTKDGVVVLGHNRMIKSSCNDYMKINMNTYNALKKSKPNLATLREALEFVSGKVPLYVEVKSYADTAKIVDVIKNYKHQYYLASKNQKTLRELHSALPQIPKIIIESWSGVRAQWRARQVDSTILSMNHRFLWSGFIKIVSRHYTIYAYTLNRPAKARYWTKFGLAGVVTDRPDLFKNS